MSHGVSLSSDLYESSYCMRTCPKEEETVETCDGMNQKNIIFDKNGLKKTAKLAKSQKNKLVI